MLEDGRYKALFNMGSIKQVIVERTQISLGFIQPYRSVSSWMQYFQANRAVKQLS